MSFHGDLERVLSEYGEQVRRAAAEDVRRAGLDCARYAREGAPRDRGVYARGFRSEFSEDAEGAHALVRNASKEAPLTHLLELGHEQFFMGEDLGRRYPGSPHIAPAFERAASEMKGRMR